ncbi:glucoamylase family protein [Pseudoxanthomonas sp. JBR18]|uniref:GH36-type glycosyl hydrolase domain-containing protein n=1 Tax=Pseudoxanthomonas sp. JBR18 TaxID=2969308 RepID=UPI0023059E74|nr:glucoamylase family protein [Pseudoxanthomonas sp. JBR18]WCE03820.1 glucoamylase family protein [Pseudoxanthomonas sp. JBR18]
MLPPWRTFLSAFSNWRSEARKSREATPSQVPISLASIRDALFGDEQMEALGEQLGQSHVLHREQGRELLLARLKSNERALFLSAASLTKAATDGRRIQPAGEWLLDNFYLVEEQVRVAGLHLPVGYSRKLPRLKAGSEIGVPRVYELARLVVAHGHGRVDAITLSRFIAAYQRRSPLMLGELWAIPIMLRLALIEDIRRASDIVMRDGEQQRLAQTWTSLLNETAARTPEHVVLVVADLARSDPPKTGAFVSELTRGIQGRGPLLNVVSTWVEQWLATDGQRLDQLIHAESQRQAADQVSISNSIGSFRFLNNMDWREFVETMSVVDQRLREDPANVYARMDFQTRDAYRRVVERLAQRAGMAELEVAQVAIGLARDAKGAPEIAGHVGYYLLDAGLAGLRTAIGSKPDIGARQLSSSRAPLALYLLPIALIAGVWSIVLMRWAPGSENGALWWTCVCLAVLCASELGVAIVNWIAALVFVPVPLARMDLRSGIPADCRTLVVMPSMLASLAAIDELISALEVHHLANRDDQLRFALLTDFLDAGQKLQPDDQALLEHAAEQIGMLNARYAPERGGLFFLLHRDRSWNAAEGCWMGHERKRGKLEALNRLLSAEDLEAQSLIEFARACGDLIGLAHVRYVITLDSDTQLPRDAARILVGAMSHPLNAPRLDTSGQVVEAGYGILQPGLGTGMRGSAESRFARMFGVEPGIDPYTRMVSDVYQDLFGEGSFIGKGIYEVATFERVVAGRFPENQVLSHDLLEGCYARAGLISDVRLYEAHAQRYATDIQRRIRWVRGDWQLLPWLLPWVPTATRRYARNPLSWLSRGKLLDNLRRSLVSPAAIVLLLIGWGWSSAPVRWTCWWLLLWVLPSVLSALYALLRLPAGTSMRFHAVQVFGSLRRQLLRAGVLIACLPYESGVQLLAIARTLFRLLVSRRHLLQWNPSSEVERQRSGSQPELRQMAVVGLCAAMVGVAIAVWTPGALWVALPLAAAWLAAPWLMRWLGLPPSPPSAKLSCEQRAFLGRLSCRTWDFFEVHCNAQHHWLPPDNVQEHPVAVVANRTSPTNIGLALLANLAAYDLGYLSLSGVLDRTSNSLATLEKLPRYRGHFFNWYDTQSLIPLPPRYVSSVDSGNLAGHLLTLRQGLLAMVDAPVVSKAVFSGLADTLSLLRDSHASHCEAVERGIALFGHTLNSVSALPEPSLRQMGEAFATMLSQSEHIVAAQRSAPMEHEGQWSVRLVERCRAARDDLFHCAPWLAGTPPLAEDVVSRGIPSLRELHRASGIVSVRSWAGEHIHQLERLAHVAGQLSLMDYGLVYSRSRHLMSIGYNVDERRLDEGHYDLLASEARLGNFVAIAQGQLPQDSWFALARTLTHTDTEPTLLSWSGSMFEYLMPQLVMPSYPQTLLARTSTGAVRAQIAYGDLRGVPWGISESGYNTVDTRRNYQYRAFGVPGLGLKRGLGRDLVIAPYASAMALMVAPDAACKNLQRLDALGFGGRFGLYEAIDYTPSRVPRGESCAVVRSFMSHHQGMSLLALDYVLRDAPMQKRFVADPEFQATLLLLQERAPKLSGVYAKGLARVTESAKPEDLGIPLRIFRDPGQARPVVQLLSNGRYHGMLTSAGGGYSKSRDMAVTRWREDGVRDHWGTFCYLRDIDSGAFWSATHQPTCVEVERYEAIFSDAKAEFKGSHLGYDTHLEIAISAEDDVELRRLTLRNRSRVTRVIEITTYAEVVLAPGLADEMHPAFSNLFIQTEVLAEKQSLLCTRRPRAQDEAQPWMFHLVAVHDADVASISYETDRSAFVGRGRTTRRPAALVGPHELSGTVGSVLDPILAIRCRIALAPGQRAQVDMVYGIGEQREICQGLIDKYRDRRLADRVFDLALTQSQVVRRQIDASLEDALLYERLAAAVLFVDPQMRADADVLLQNRRGQSALWSHAISGDLPIVLLRVADSDSTHLARQMVQTHAYWRLKGLRVDLVIWNESQAGYRQALQDNLVALISSDPEANVLDRPGGIFVRSIEHIAQEDRVLLQTVARVILNDAHGTLAAQLEQLTAALQLPPVLQPSSANSTPRLEHRDASHADRPSLDAAPGEVVQFDNGLGAFVQDGSEYRIVLEEGVCTPAPWCNVMANAQFGTVVSESNPGYTWAENAHEFRLTPWHNDPVSDASGEAFYLRDEENGQVWSPTPLPCRGRGRYEVRHGFGYSVYRHVEQGISSELWVFVDLERAVKYSLLRLENLSGQPRRLSATGYVEWVLADIRARSQLHVATELDLAGGVLIAWNAFNTAFDGRVAFFDVDAPSRSVTGDRSEFLGRNGSLADPAALRRQRLSGQVGAGLDSCAALQIPVDLAAGQVFETVFRLGAASGRDAALSLASQVRGVPAAQAALEAVRQHWHQVLGVVQVSTPDPAVNLLANGWLLYQTIACRYLARSGYYQSGGAFGFRDQLQDSMAMVHARPALARAHLLRCAAQQFVQGDVQHWWHPPQGHGVRTHCSDDFLWLPQALCRYLDSTADVAVLEEQVGFIEGRALNADEESYYDSPRPLGPPQTLYQHCKLALQHGLLRMGTHGLPLIGSGDWNDGLNRVGKEGKGESVWLAFFLYDTLKRFAPVAARQGDQAFSDRCLHEASGLRESVETHGWDGQWYRRAWYDDGTPLGSTASVECQIDSLSQSWAVLSGAGRRSRTQQGMDAVQAQLVDLDAGLIKLLTPAFDRTTDDPGYIRGYVPGVRENGGQYTHAAVWVSMAFAALGDSRRAWEMVDLINPIHHAHDAVSLQRYKVEPYVMAADVYAAVPHQGRGGWSWYTGAAGWMYRLLTESLLGLGREGDRMRMTPCMPLHWDRYEMTYQMGASNYRIVVRRHAGGTASMSVDGVVMSDPSFALVDDGARHEVLVEIPEAG